MKVYEVNHWNNKIAVRYAIRETDQSFFFVAHDGRQERREAKKTNGYRLFASWKEARQYIIAREKAQIGAANLMLEEAKEWFERALNIPETEPEQ